MKSLQQIKDEQENKVSELLKECGVFFAFSNEQFDKNKTPLQEGEKYVSMGMGGYLPKSKSDQYIKGIDKIGTWFKAEIKANKARRDYILYELANHEAWYTMDISDTLDALGEDYTESEVMEVFRAERKNQSVEY